MKDELENSGKPDVVPKSSFDYNSQASELLNCFSSHNPVLNKKV